MTIRSFAFEDLETGWKLEETEFQQLNLLVGPSGAGKTRILDALLRVRSAALGSTRGPCQWQISLNADGQIYTWSAETLAKKNPLQSKVELDRLVRYQSELLLRGKDILIDRSPETFWYKGRTLPLLQTSDSAIHLLQEEPSIVEFYDALAFWNYPSLPNSDSRVILQTQETPVALEDLQRTLGNPSFYKALVLQETYPEKFQGITESFIEIFPAVSGVRVGTFSQLKADLDIADAEMLVDRELTVAVREQHVDKWLPTPLLSAGMLKVFAFLVELSLATPGSVFLVDELENSLGVNCLPELAEQLLSKSHEIQFILTSHHPQVINKIPSRYWKLVTRRGSTVRVIDAETLPALKTASSLEKFTQLINLPEFEEGVA